MNVLESKFADQILDVYSPSHGTYYFFKDFMISEVAEDVVFDWEKAMDLINYATEVYPEDRKITYIANRIHKYSVVPTDWYKFFNSAYGKNFVGYCIVAYDQRSLLNSFIEKVVFSNIIKFENADTLDEAIHWAQINQE